MKTTSARVWMAVAAVLGLAVTATHQQAAAKPGVFPRPTLEERIIELESKVSRLELQLFQVRMSTARIPKLGPQLVDQR